MLPICTAFIGTNKQIPHSQLHRPLRGAEGKIIFRILPAFRKVTEAEGYVLELAVHHKAGCVLERGTTHDSVPRSAVRKGETAPPPSVRLPVGSKSHRCTMSY